MEKITLTLPSSQPIQHEQSSNWCLILDPHSTFVIYWNRFMLLVLTFNIFVDSCFFYVPIVKGNFILIDFKPATSLALMRTIGDFFHIFGMIVKFRTAYEAPGSRVFKRRELVMDSGKISRKYLFSIFILDLIAVLPLFQVYLLFKLPELKSSSASDGMNYYHLSIIIFFQSSAKMALMSPLRKKIVETSGNITNHGWSGAIYFLLIYIMLSQFIGAFYYINYIFQLSVCRVLVLQEEGNASVTSSDWTQLIDKCDMKDRIERGIFSNIHENRIGSRSFLQRSFYCFSWGLKSLSSMGQNFESSFATLETVTSFFMSICGLALFAGLIAQMQTSIQSTETGEEKHIVRLREIEEWTKIQQLPPELKKRVRQTVSSELFATRRIDEKSILDLLPSELQCDVRRHFYLDLVSKLPFFANLDSKLVLSFCGYLRTFSSTKGTCLVVEGEPVRQMFFIYSGLLEGMVLDVGCSSLREGDLCGTELLAWVLQPSASTHNLPSSTQTVMCLTNIDAFCILAEDLKLLSVQFDHDSKFQQALSSLSQLRGATSCSN